MYAQVIQGMVAPGYATDYEGYIDQLLTFLEQQPGFQGGWSSNSVGQPSKYAFTTLWENAAAARAVRVHPAFRSFVEANRAIRSITTMTQPTEAYEPLILEMGTGDARFVVNLAITIDPLQTVAFEQLAKTRVSLLQKVGRGLVSHVVSRYLGSPGRYGVVLAYLTREDAEATLQNPELQRSLQEHPISEFGGSQTAEFFEVLKAVVPRPAAASASAAPRR